MAWGHPDKTPETETWRKFLGQQVGIDLDASYRPLRTHDNRFWQDREAMKAGNFTGIKGFPNQDIAMWVTMGPIADRTEERLGASDVAVVEFRRRMLDALKAFQAGEEAIGTGENAIPRSVCSFQAMVPKDTDWKQFAAQPVWVETATELESNYQVQV
jgi:phthalate 4,5-dioxygenase oxygenase subunit